MTLQKYKESARYANKKSPLITAGKQWIIMDISKKSAYVSNDEGARSAETLLKL